MTEKSEVDLPTLRGLEEETLLRKKLFSVGKLTGGLFYVSPSSFYLQTSSGIAEIDALLLHESGMYVFECKHMTGSITGKARDRLWTKTGDGHVISFTNPILQNKRHVEIAASFFGLKGDNCISCVVFNDSCDVSRVDAGNAFITKTGEILNSIKPYLKRRVFSEDELRLLIKKAEKAVMSREKLALAHAANIREAKQRKKGEKKRNR